MFCLCVRKTLLCTLLRMRIRFGQSAKEGFHIDFTGSRLMNGIDVQCAGENRPIYACIYHLLFHSDVY